MDILALILFVLFTSNIADTLPTNKIKSFGEELKKQCSLGFVDTLFEELKFVPDCPPYEELKPVDKLTRETERDVLCSLFYDSLFSFCEEVEKQHLNIDKIDIQVFHKFTTKIVCGKLFPDNRTLKHDLQKLILPNKCEKLCTAYEGNEPATECSLAHYFASFNISSLIVVPKSDEEVKGSSDTISKTPVTNVQTEVEDANSDGKKTNNLKKNDSETSLISQNQRNESKSPVVNLDEGTHSINTGNDHESTLKKEQAVPSTDHGGKTIVQAFSNPGARVLGNITNDHLVEAHAHLSNKIPDVKNDKNKPPPANPENTNPAQVPKAAEGPKPVEDPKPDADTEPAKDPKPAADSKPDADPKPAEDPKPDTDPKETGDLPPINKISTQEKSGPKDTAENNNGPVMDIAPNNGGELSTKMDQNNIEMDENRGIKSNVEDDVPVENEFEEDPESDLLQQQEKIQDIQPAPAVDHRSKSKPLEISANEDNVEELDGSSYFFSYFMVVCVFFVLGYVGYHNRVKVMALVLEGKRNKRQYRGRRPNSANYHKLDSNLEEAISSSCTKNSNNVIY